MELVLQRMDSRDDSTYGVLSHYKKHLSFIIEDEKREVKVKGETRIPAGRYRIKYREVLSPLTIKYRSKFPDWFTWHLWLQDVPNFEFILLHIGNYESNSEGCLLTNKGVREVNDEWQGLDSTSAFKEVYEYIKPYLVKGEEVWLNVRDEDYFITPF